MLAQLLWWAAAASWARKQQTTNVITIDIPLDNWLLLSHVLDNFSSLGNQFALYCCKSAHNVIRISEENKKYMMKCVLIHSNGDFGQNRKQNTNYQDLIWIKIIWQPKNLHVKIKMLTNKYLTNSSLVTMLNYAGTPVLFWARVRNCCCCCRAGATSRIFCVAILLRITSLMCGWWSSDKYKKSVLDFFLARA